MQVYYEATTNPSNFAKMYEKAKKMIKKSEAKKRSQKEDSSKAKDSESEEGSVQKDKK